MKSAPPPRPHLLRPGLLEPAAGTSGLGLGPHLNGGGRRRRIVPSPLGLRGGGGGDSALFL